jgi:hypothetical protein
MNSARCHSLTHTVTVTVFVTVTLVLLAIRRIRLNEVNFVLSQIHYSKKYSETYFRVQDVLYGSLLKSQSFVTGVCKHLKLFSVVAN